MTGRLQFQQSEDNRMTASNLPSILTLDATGEGIYRVNHPENDPEGRNIVFGGQMMAQMIMAADAAVGGEKETKSIHTIFSRAGTYDMPLDLEVDTMQAGRAFASHTITGIQNDKLMSRAMVLQTVGEPDLIRHAPSMPDVPGPDEVKPSPELVVYPGSDAREIRDPDAVDPDGSPVLRFWIRDPNATPGQSFAAHQASLVWSQVGLLIGLAIRPHKKIDISQAHITLSTGVIAHTAHFHEPFDIGDWLLIEQRASWAGRGRVHGSGQIFDSSGQYVASFNQDSMARTAPKQLGDARRAM
jgi:acyl-CoA thioesterase-2